MIGVYYMHSHGALFSNKLLYLFVVILSGPVRLMILIVYNEKEATTSGYKFHDKATILYGLCICTGR